MTAEIRNPGKTYGFLNDVIFKSTFGREKNEKLLICLLNALLMLKGKEKITDIVILNPFQLQAFPADKLSILDVKAKDGNGRRYNVEVQVCPENSFVARALFYLSKLFCEQLGKGAPFDEIRKCTSISILEAPLFPSDKAIRHAFRLRNIETGGELTDLIEMHFLELSKFDVEKPVQLRTSFEKWLHLLKFGELWARYDSLVPETLKHEEGIPMAIEQLRRANAEASVREIVEMYDKALHDEATRLSSALNSGLARGREEGEKIGEARGKEIGAELGKRVERAELVRKMLSANVSRDFISQTLGISDGEIDDLLSFSESQKQTPVLLRSPEAEYGKAPAATKARPGKKAETLSKSADRKAKPKIQAG